MGLLSWRSSWADAKKGRIIFSTGSFQSHNMEMSWFQMRGWWLQHKMERSDTTEMWGGIDVQQQSNKSWAGQKQPPSYHKARERRQLEEIWVRACCRCASMTSPSSIDRWTSSGHTRHKYTNNDKGGNAPRQGCQLVTTVHRRKRIWEFLDASRFEIRILSRDECEDKRTRIFSESFLQGK